MNKIPNGGNLIGAYFLTNDFQSASALREQFERTLPENFIGAPIRFYVDKDRTRSFPAFVSLLNDILAGEIDTLVCLASADLKALFGTLQDFTTHVRLLSDQKIIFLPLQEGQTVSTDSAEFVILLLESYRKFKSSIKTNAALRGFNTARAHGKKIGRPGKLDIPTVKKLRAKGCTLAEISKKFNVSIPAVRQALLKKVDQADHEHVLS